MSYTFSIVLYCNICIFFLCNEEKMKLYYSGYSFCDSISKPAISQTSLRGEIVTNMEILSESFTGK